MSGFWVFLLLMGVMAFLIWVGYLLARDRSSAERDELDVQRQVLDTEWRALEQTRRVNDVFFRARDAMRRAEADAFDQERRRRP